MKSIPLNILSNILIGLKDGLSYREIQKQYGASKSTVARISERLSQAGLSAQEAISLDETELQALFYPPREKTLIEPDWQKIHNKLQQRKVTLLLMYEDYEQQAEGLGHISTPILHSVVDTTIGSELMASVHYPAILIVNLPKKLKLTLPVISCNGLIVSEKSIQPNSL